MITDKFNKLSLPKVEIILQSQGNFHINTAERLAWIVDTSGSIHMKTDICMNMCINV